MSGHNTDTAAPCESVESVSRARINTWACHEEYLKKYHLWSPVMMPMEIAECEMLSAPVTVNLIHVSIKPLKF